MSERKSKGIIKCIGALTAVSIATTSIWQFVSSNALEVSAQNAETLPGIEQIRESIVESGGSYRILEIAPDVNAGEIGFYVGGQEPFAALLNPDYAPGAEDKQWFSWLERLSKVYDIEERLAIMEQVEAEYDKFVSSLTGAGASPVGYTQYKEYPDADDSDGYSYFDIESATKRGYFEAAPSEDAEWVVVFEALNNWNISLEEINKGKDTAYYRAFYDESLPLTGVEIWEMAQGKFANVPLYTNNEGKLVYFGTAAEVWNRYGVMVGVSDGDATVEVPTVSSGDSMVSAGDAGFDFYDPTFELINNVNNNQITVGDQVYLVSSRKTYHEEENGLYRLVEVTAEENAGGLFVVPGKRVYYTGGLTNTEVLRTGGFGLVDDVDKFDVIIHTYTTEMLNELTREQIQSYDAVYIGNGATKNAYRQEGENPYVYSFEYAMEEIYNLTVDTVNALADHIVNGKIPCIMDVANFTKDNSYDPDMKVGFYLNKLQMMLLATKDAKTEFFEENMVNLRDLYLANTQMQGTTFPAVQYIFENYGDVPVVDSYGDKTRASAGYFDIDSDKNMYIVRENVLIFSSENLAFIRKGFTTGLDGEACYEETLLQKDFDVVYDEILNENRYRQADTSYTEDRYLDEKLFDGTVLRYVLNYPQRRAISEKNSITVLKLEAATNDSSEANVLAENLKKWAGVGKVVVEPMAITEFIGRIEDLNDTYDLIYIGDSLTNLNTRSSGTSTDYNDSKMDGMIYTHVGDTVTGTANITGLLDTDYTVKNVNGETQYWMKNTSTQRFTGTDLTLEKYNAILDFLDASYPVVVADSLVKIENRDGKYVATGANKNTVDNSSYLYELINGQIVSRENMFFVSEISDGHNNEFIFYVDREKLSVAGTVLNVTPYANNSAVMETSRVNGKYQFAYQFTISNEGAVSRRTNYTCSMYIDSNADGKFSGTEEKLAGIMITDRNGNRVDANKLKAGEIYTVNRQIPDNFRGCITWMIEIHQNENNYIRTHETGYLKLKVDAGEEPAIIKILQIYFNYADTGNMNNYNLILQNRVGTLNADKTGYDGGNTNDYFRKNLELLKEDYLLDITSIPRDVYETYVAKTTNGDGTEVYANLIPGTEQYYNEWIADFDMLIVGFSDGYDGNVYNDWSANATNEILAFADTGKSVLLAHDVTSLSNIIPGNTAAEANNEVYYYNSNGQKTDYPEWYWGYNMNRMIRDLLGMDMYGVTVDSRLRTGYGLSATDIAELQPTKNEKGRYIYNVKDLAFTPGAGRASTVGETQGQVYASLVNRGDADITFRKNIAYGNSFPCQVNTVRKVNEGQITNYPFYIADNIGVGTTHSQYYTLNMNDDADLDGQTDLVVWFTLAEQIYDKSPKDIRNNYYIFNKGNITYTGMGHGTKPSYSGDNRLTENEAKLFLNTMIASYQAGLKGPEVSMVDDAGNSYDTSYCFYDEVVETEGSHRIHFMVSDVNISMAASGVQVEFYVESGSGSVVEDVDNELVVQKLTGLSVCDLSGTVVDVNNLQSGVIYYVDVPLTYLAPNDAVGNEVTFFVRAKMNDVMNNIWDVKPYHYINAQLFDLD